MKNPRHADEGSCFPDGENSGAQSTTLGRKNKSLRVPPLAYFLRITPKERRRAVAALRDFERRQGGAA